MRKPLAALVAFSITLAVPAAPAIVGPALYFQPLPGGSWGLQMEVNKVTIDSAKNDGAEAVLKAKPITATQWQTLKTLNLPTGTGALRISGPYGQHPPGSQHHALLRITNNQGNPPLHADALATFEIPDP